ncbi:hypothetical protein ACTI_61560 [Actinoplanes sp. OR16]|uniref:hypothetical protein n=1 Tax=Actinoplanes sp. OR16 TaxID=946334 RepID=UPI000F71DE6F|nr:hypothetical protein [Actinoplanes sp. OR16]BBH69471.1 hypothetical protein ACTI_61560 [Actinoplanes sp. OR16]
MTSTSTDRRPSGLVTGSLIAISFGTVFIMVNSGGLPAPWPLVIRVAGAIAAVVLLIAVFRKDRATTGGPPARGFSDKWFRIILAAEVIALFGGLYLINGVWGRPSLGVAWIATVVGIHFFGLARAWRMPLYHGLGAVMTVLGLAGFAIYAMDGSDAAIGLVAGVGSGVALFGTVAVAIRK